jgi:hypothetical protein
MAERGFRGSSGLSGRGERIEIQREFDLEHAGTAGTAGSNCTLPLPSHCRVGLSFFVFRRKRRGFVSRAVVGCHFSPLSWQSTIVEKQGVFRVARRAHSPSWQTTIVQNQGVFRVAIQGGGNLPARWQSTIVYKQSGFSRAENESATLRTTERKRKRSWMVIALESPHSLTLGR